MASGLFLWKSGCLLTSGGMIAGAFGSHALKARLGAKVDTWHVGSNYLIFNGLALLAISQHPVYSRSKAPLFILGGAIVFSGSIFGLLLSPKLRFLGPVTPLGKCAFSLAALSVRPPRMYSFLIGGFSHELQILHFNELESTLKRSIAKGTPFAYFTWIIPANVEHCYYGLQALPGEAGQVHLFKYTSAMLQLLQSVPTEGNDPCHGNINETELVITNYDSSNIFCINIDPAKGLLIPESLKVIECEGSSINQTRQEAAHPHGAFYHQASSRWLVTDLGSDRLTWISEKALAGEVTCAPGDGPRHLCISRDGSNIYVVNELTNTVKVYSYSPAFDLQLTYTQSVLPTGASGSGMSASAILLSPDERFLYITNRDESHREGDAIVWFEKTDSDFTRRGELRTGLDHPRGAAITKDGRFLITGSKTKEGVVVYSIDAEDGSLKEAARTNDVHFASCFLEV